MKLLPLLLIFFPQWISKDILNEWIVWNVGQGSWSTIVTSRFCIHFDMGGEFFKNAPALFKKCMGKNNILALSHLDQDHTRFAKNWGSRLQTCLLLKSTFKPHHKIPHLPSCKSSPKKLKLISKSTFRNRNESHIYNWNNHLLFMGDAGADQERQLFTNWALIKYIVVSHHGSKTSSHPLLIKKMSNVQQAVVSARKKKYGHPHTKTKNTFNKANIPLITTEEFGTLVFEI